MAHDTLSERVLAALTAPLGYAMCGAITLNSTLRVVTGRGVEWRGRRYSGRLGTNRS